jgi:hypothetical protein
VVAEGEEQKRQQPARGRSAYRAIFGKEEPLPARMNDFVDGSLRDKELDVYRKRSYELDPLVNRPGEPDPEAVAELRSMIEILRSPTPTR